MVMKKTIIVGGLIGLIVPIITIVILWFGLGFGISIDGINITNLLWPSSIMLIRGWRSTLPGVMITLSSIVINCLLYAGVLLLMRSFVCYFKNKISYKP